MKEIDPKNLTAQLNHRARGNPPSTQPASAIANCFPGLEFDFRAVWRRVFVGLEMHEARPVVVRVEDDMPAEVRALEGRVLFAIDGEELWVERQGPQVAGGPNRSLGFANLEWSNALATIVRRGGQTVEGAFLGAGNQVVTVDLEIRRIFAEGEDGEELPAIAREAAEPGELTQGLCSPWQNDYLECACYYWAASRPDFVNAEEVAPGETRGHNWLHRDRDATTPLGYSLRASDLVTYEELFRDWERALRFVVGGRDEQES